MDELGLVVVAKCVTVQAPQSKDGQVTDMAAKTQQHDLLLVNVPLSNANHWSVI